MIQTITSNWKSINYVFSSPIFIHKICIHGIKTNSWYYCAAVDIRLALHQTNK